MWSWQNESLTHRIKWVAHKEMASQGVLPDYLNDLNAMHEAEKVLNELSWMHYLQKLAEIVRKPKQCEIRISQYVHANATQRAEAFLRAIGKWEKAQ
jgi:hypothetical protein